MDNTSYSTAGFRNKSVLEALDSIQKSGYPSVEIGCGSHVDHPLKNKELNDFNKELNNVISNGIKINIIGQLNKLPTKIRSILNKAIKLTKHNKKIIVNLAINYGSKVEIVNALQKLKNKNKISINSLNKNLYTNNLPDPDILIRTGGHNRLSNFMLWQLAYAEIYFLDKLWPDFKSSDLKRIINNFKKIKRNFGSI